MRQAMGDVSVAEVGAFIRSRRAAALLTQEELAHRAGVDARTIRDIETGRTTKPRASTVRMLVGALAAVVPHKDPRPALARPRELPPDTIGFTGRSGSLAELDRLLGLAKPHPTAVVIAAVSGTAGVGKTALAVHWAHRMADAFPDGQLYADLRGYDPGQPVAPTDVLAAFLDSLGGVDIPPGQAERASRLRTLLAERRMLILLDNAFDSEQVRDLIPGTPGSVVLVTSRDSLAGLVVRHGAHRVDLDPLPANEALALLRVSIGGRVHAEPVAATALAEQCARLPLALRIAAQLAATRPTATLAELVTELADQHHRLDLLDTGDPHSSVRTVFSWSYRHLPEPAARLFRLLGPHPGRDIDLPAAAALAGTDLRVARQHVDMLARANLLQETGRNRYGMHDLLRAYAARLARDQDPPHTQPATLERLAGYLNASPVAAAQPDRRDRSRSTAEPPRPPRPA
jgi:transcriptional regulator with XRE-family HTH domain